VHIDEEGTPVPIGVKAKTRLNKLLKKKTKTIIA
jgi:hypothetical protein